MSKLKTDMKTTVNYHKYKYLPKLCFSLTLLCYKSMPTCSCINEEIRSFPFRRLLPPTPMYRYDRLVLTFPYVRLHLRSILLRQSVSSQAALYQLPWNACSSVTFLLPLQLTRYFFYFIRLLCVIGTETLWDILWASQKVHHIWTSLLLNFSP